MKLMSPVSIDTAERIVWSYEQAFPSFGVTEVVIVRDDSGTQSDFSIKKFGRSRRNFFRLMNVELIGHLDAVSAEQTGVDVHFVLGLGGLLNVVICILILSVPILAGSQVDALSIPVIIIGGFVVLFASEIYVMYRVIRSLKLGIYRK